MKLLPRLRLLSSITLGLILAGAAFSTGCAKSGKVAGKVTLPDGSPLPGGIIYFAPENEKANPATAIIAEDGTYSCTVPVGNCKVWIDNRTAGKSSTPIGAGGIPAPPKTPPGGQGAGGGAKTPMMPGKGMPPGGPGGPGGGGGKIGGGPSEKDLKGGNEDVANRMRQAGADKAGASTPVPGKVVPINSKYFSGETSGLTIEVGGGTQTFDIKLEK